MRLEVNVLYYIGIDSSSAFSRLIAVDNDYKVIGRHAGNSVNPSNLSRDTILENLKKLIYEFNKLTNTSLSDCVAVCVGASGIKNEQDSKNMTEILSEVLKEKDGEFVGSIKAVNDAEMVIATETKGGPGMTVIANSGSFGYAIGHDTKRHRCGGWGHLIDDAGSGYYIGMSAIKHALMAYDGREEKTILSEKICEHFKLKGIEEIVDIVYSEAFNRAKIAELAITVKHASEAGDKAAAEIEDAAAVELSRLACSLIEKSKLLDGTMVLSGSAILLNDNIRNKLTALIVGQYKDIKIMPLKEKPEMGAIHLAMLSVALQ